MTEVSLSPLADFLLARIAEDENDAWNFHGIMCGFADDYPCNCGRPDRVLAEVEAKKRLVEQFDQDPWCLDGGWVYTDYALRELATAYASHPDYRESWRP